MARAAFLPASGTKGIEESTALLHFVPAVFHPEEVPVFLDPGTRRDFQPFAGRWIVTATASPLVKPKKFDSQQEMF